jgi:hypothetical protein
MRDRAADWGLPALVEWIEWLDNGALLRLARSLTGGRGLKRADEKSRAVAAALLPFSLRDLGAGHVFFPAPCKGG